MAGTTPSTLERDNGVEIRSNFLIPARQSHPIWSNHCSRLQRLSHHLGQSGLKRPEYWNCPAGISRHSGDNPR